MAEASAGHHHWYFGALQGLHLVLEFQFYKHSQYLLQKKKNLKFPSRKKHGVRVESKRTRRRRKGCIRETDYKGDPGSQLSARPHRMPWNK
jgi:hypothetical protein